MKVLRSTVREQEVGGTPIQRKPAAVACADDISSSRSQEDPAAEC